MLGAVKAVGWQLWAERLGAGGLGTGAARPHIPACPQSGIVLATPLVSQGLLEGTDGCQMPGAPSPREDSEERGGRAGTDVTTSGTGVLMS